MDTILRSEVLKLVDTGASFDMEFVTADRRRGTGGKLIELKAWQKKIGQPVEDTIPGQHIRRTKPKDPNHYKHGTINVFNPANKAVHPHKVHVPLIQTFNGKKVVNG
jgi:hypothetical protein